MYGKKRRALVNWCNSQLDSDSERSSSSLGMTVCGNEKMGTEERKNPRVTLALRRRPCSAPEDVLLTMGSPRIIGRILRRPFVLILGSLRRVKIVRLLTSSFGEALLKTCGRMISASREIKQSAVRILHYWRSTLL